VTDPTPNRHRSPLEHERDMDDKFDPAAIRRFYDCVECVLDPHGAASTIRALAAELATARELIGLLEGEQARADAAEAALARVRAETLERAARAVREIHYSEVALRDACDGPSDPDWRVHNCGATAARDAVFAILALESQHPAPGEGQEGGGDE
jgi:hypothetical protein